MKLEIDKCQHCGEPIYLFRVGTAHYKWFTNVGNRSSWKCPGPGLPVRGHEPTSDKNKGLEHGLRKAKAL
jgi:hypothetical protein